MHSLAVFDLLDLHNSGRYIHNCFKTNTVLEAVVPVLHLV